MSRRCHVALVVAMVTFAAIPAVAQRTDSTAATDRDAPTDNSLSCPRAGSMARVWAGVPGDSAVRESGSPPPRAYRARGVVDTVITIDIADRTWRRDTLAAGVALGMAGTAGGRQAPWHACAGATATLERITATLHNVHGKIHLRADPRALDAIGRMAGSTLPAPPRR